MSGIPTQRRLRVMMVGMRGFPGVQGGVEVHAENLCKHLVALGCDVVAVVRSPYMSNEATSEPWEGVKYLRLWSPRSKAFEALGHTLLAVFAAALRRPDILHIQAIGPSIWAPLARLFGLRVVVTHHGPHYEWQKWGRVARFLLRLGERIGMHFANARIAISPGIVALIERKYGLDAALVGNGVAVPPLPESAESLRDFSLEPARYVLHVGRLVAEKRHPDLIEGFRRAALPGWKLAIVGGADHPDEYSRGVQRLADSVPGVVLTGRQGGRALQELFGNAGAFVLPSSHEGMSIALLEALSFGVPVIASDIPGNRAFDLAERAYFPVGDVDGIAERLREIASMPQSAEAREQTRDRVRTKFSWESRAAATLSVYRQVLARSSCA